MMNVALAVAAGIATLAVMYGVTAFVLWDADWLRDLATWNAQDRFGLLYMTLCLFGIASGMVLVNRS